MYPHARVHYRNVSKRDVRCADRDSWTTSRESSTTSPESSTTSPESSATSPESSATSPESLTTSPESSTTSPDSFTTSPNIHDDGELIVRFTALLFRAPRVACSVGLTLRTELRGGSDAEADAARRLPPLRLMRCGRRAAVTLERLPSRLGRRANGSPPRQLLCGVRPHGPTCYSYYLAVRASE